MLHHSKGKSNLKTLTQQVNYFLWLTCAEKRTRSVLSSTEIFFFLNMEMKVPSISAICFHLFLIATMNLWSLLSKHLKLHSPGFGLFLTVNTFWLRYAPSFTDNYTVFLEGERVYTFLFKPIGMVYWKNQTLSNPFSNWKGWKEILPFTSG